MPRRRGVTMISTPVKLVGCHPEIVATADINLVAAATALIPALRSRSSETDALARLPDSTIADLEKAHLFDMLVPKIYGGPLREPSWTWWWNWVEGTVLRRGRSLSSRPAPGWRQRSIQSTSSTKYFPVEISV